MAVVIEPSVAVVDSIFIPQDSTIGVRQHAAALQKFWSYDRPVYVS